MANQRERPEGVSAGAYGWPVTGGYYCRQCRIVQPEMVCPGCYQFLTEDGSAIDAYLPEPETPQGGRVGCMVCVAHWGDTMHAMSHTRQVMERLGQASCDALYYGPDPAIAEFIGAQDWVRRVHMAAPGANYSKYVRSAINRIAPASEWAHLLAEDIPEAPAACELYADGLANYWASRQRRVIPAKFALPPARVSAAKDFLRSLKLPKGTRPVLLHPSSTWSAGQAMHWPHWREAVSWLLSETPHTYLLTGLNGHDYGQHPRLIDATGKLPSNMENLALASLCGKAVTTCNSVALWCASDAIPALVCGNAAITSHVNPFRRYIDRAPNTYLPVEASFEDFTRAAARLLLEDKQ